MIRLQTEEAIYIALWLVLFAVMVRAILQRPVNPELADNACLLHYSVELRLDGTENLPHLDGLLDTPGAYAASRPEGKR